jgi:SAM-dependent methyltransferase
LMYFPDRIAALKEMWRVLRLGGRLAIAVWGPFERATAYVLLTEITKLRWGDAATEVLTAPFVLGDQEKLIYLFKAAGIDEVAVELHQGTIKFPSIEVFVETEVKGSPLEDCIDEESYRSVIKEAEDKLQRFVVEDGVVMPMDAFIITAEKS